ncbi:phenylacetate--CoA ligase family protein [Shewanella aquimarina]|uniref:phenylacetate--CoA ligase family protein n=1 Tax=Shewanella aquimarina TaxID=260365 RepID=UPI002014D025|nr:AMP-binding protein [Shewanella aquimarina]MCL2908667.1 AMP-binding protein [Shewanella aquimarina]
MAEYFKPQEAIAPAEREQQLMAALPEQLGYASRHCDYFARLFEGIDLTQINSREALATLPITRKADLIRLQAEQPPFAGMTPDRPSGRIFQSPGPILDPECDGHDWWRMGQAFFAAGFRPGDTVQNCLAYHLTPGGFIMDSGAKACGCTVIPAGPGQTEMQLALISSIKPNGYCGTPSFLNILLEKGREQGMDTSSITKALVSGEALTPSLKASFEAADIDVKQAYVTADLGLIAFESVSGEGLVVAEDIIVEIVRPGTLTPVPEGEVGEVVVTSFNRDYPLVRFATGDLSAIMPGTSACGRTNVRIKGWLGRADQTTKVKGLFVHPEQVERVRARHPGIVKVRLVVTRQQDNDVMRLLCEVDETMRPQLDIAAVQASIRAETQLSGEVALVAPGALADDGVVIEDQR